MWAKSHLTGDCHFVKALIAHRRLGLVAVVKGDGDCGLGDARLSVFVDQLLKQSRLRVS